MEKTIKALDFDQVSDDLNQVMDDVCTKHEPVILKRQKDESVVMISLADYNGLKETIYLLSSPSNASRLQSSIRQFKRDK